MNLFTPLRKEIEWWGNALQALTSALNKADVARTAIVAWYYGVYSAASRMAKKLKL